MTAQLLSNDLSNLIQETKRKYPELKAAAESSLAEIKSLPSISEQQTTADLRRRPEFIRPFLLACKTGNPKYASLSIISLQRLVAANGLATEKLDEVLQCLRDCINLGTEVQLRILQIMPTLFQQCGDRITESRLSTALRLCFLLQASKNGIITNTAAATLQQVVNVVFGRIGSDVLRSEAASPETTKISWQAELDCHQVLQDLCLIADGKPVKSLERASVSEDFAFELIGSILVNYKAVLPKYTNFTDILRQQLLPLILRILSSNESFNSTIRALRIILPIVEGFLEILPTELEMLFSILTYMLEPEAAPLWKRAMCMEVIRDIYKETSLVYRAYAIFDQRDGHKAIVHEQLTMISHVAAENPTIIGLGHSSSLPTTTELSGEDLDGLSALQADPLTATTGVSLTSKTSTDSGISSNASTLKISLIDQLDKSDPPKIPSSYLYALSLTAFNNLCEGMARFILPFASSKALKTADRNFSGPEFKDDVRGKDDHLVPTNPYKLKEHREFAQICASYEILQKCWPAILSTYATFFQAALDSDFYHGAIRAFQKLIQVVSLFRLSTPRDKLLTALAKQSIPFESTTMSGVGIGNADREGAKPSAIISTRMSPRNLLCLRALLNLGIALGAVLDDAWNIILDTLQQADVIIGQISSDRTLSKGGPAIIAPAVAVGQELSTDFGGEVSAVRSAASRMLSSTGDLPTEQFKRFLRVLANQIHGNGQDRSSSLSELGLSKYNQSKRSLEDGVLMPEIRANVFVIDAFSQVSEFNISRFATGEPGTTGWSMLIASVSTFVTEDSLDAEVRTAAADTICKSVINATSDNETQMKTKSLIPYGFSVLQNLAKEIRKRDVTSSNSHSRQAEEEIHGLILQTLKNCLDEYGDRIESGWEDVCELLLSAFCSSKVDVVSPKPAPVTEQPVSSKILRSAFSSLQTMCSDIIETVPLSCLSKVLRAIHLCCHQNLDLNISLTATTLYQSISDHIWTGKDSLVLAEDDVMSQQHSDPTPEKLWMQTLTDLCEASAVVQSEIRSSAVHACFRILSGVSDKLEPPHWGTCFLHVIIKLYKFNRSAREKVEKTQDLISYDETAVAIQNGTCGLLEDALSTMLEWKGIVQLWPVLGAEISAFLSRKSLALSTAVYLGLNGILESVDDESMRFSICSPMLWDIWAKNNPYGHERLDRPASADNQTALIAYITYAMSLYKVSTMSQRVGIAPAVIHGIKRSVSGSTQTSYINDLHATTDLQDECLRLLDVVYENTQISISPMFLSSVGDLAILPHTSERLDREMKGPTFVAFSKLVLRVISRCIRDRAESCNLHEKAETVQCLEALRMIIQQKTVWKREDQQIMIWRDSVTAAVESSIPLVKCSSDEKYPKSSFRIWKAVLLILDSSLSFGNDEDTDDKTLKSDIDFEIWAFTEFIQLLVPSLGSEFLPDEARQKFAEVLLLRSLIHETHPEDSLAPNEEALTNNPERLGRVGDLPPSRHLKLCYLILDWMFEIVEKEKISKDYGRLAGAIAPYLLLRVEVVLKAYISDQPLRGRMPCPLSQKKELWHVLQRSMEMTKNEKSHDVGQPLEEEPLSVLHTRGLAKLAVAAMRVTKYDDGTRDKLMQLMES